MWGVEVEFEWYPEFVQGLTFDGAYSYLNTEVTNGSE